MKRNHLGTRHWCLSLPSSLILLYISIECGLSWVWLSEGNHDGNYPTFSSVPLPDSGSFSPPFIHQTGLLVSPFWTFSAAPSCKVQQTVLIRSSAGWWFNRSLSWILIILTCNSFCFETHRPGLKNRKVLKRTNSFFERTFVIFLVYNLLRFDDLLAH